MTTGFPSNFSAAAAKARPGTSKNPPGGYTLISETGLVGYSAGKTGLPHAMLIVRMIQQNKIFDRMFRPPLFI
jgi:hypothetical protein